jgi:hypothetical protein
MKFWRVALWVVLGAIGATIIVLGLDALEATALVVGLR